MNFFRIFLKKFRIFRIEKLIFQSCFFSKQLLVTKKYWRSAGNSKNFSSRIHKRSRCFFRLTKLHKKTIWKAAAKENFTNSMQNSSPHFANILLCAAQFSIFQQFFQIFSSKFVKTSPFSFSKNIFGSFSNSFSFFFIVKQQIFSVWRFSTANFQAFIFFNFVLRKIFFRIIFVKFQRQIFQIFEELKFKISSRIFWAIAHNVFRLGDVAEIEAQKLFYY